ncbi:M28 family metallopeptidase [Flavisolibacter nicotianae]|uniref:M28 family metallopeptidase n=1 Tax=Flavisolibacter nicotianae TaxID=2364882 RepID=UPI000EB5A635|nr:M28 family metallopeptidase [Flavisolibacter nicotianae]
MKKRFLLSLTGFALLVNTLSAQLTPALKQTLANVSPDAIKGHMTFLADDLVEGRMPGTRGFALASKYMESQFIALGLQPGIGDTAYVQKVPLQKGWVEENSSTFTLTGKNNKEESLAYGKEFLLQPYFAAAESKVTALLVFVGFGVSAPEFHYDDYKDIDVKGKIVVYLQGAPKGFPENERAYFATADAKYAEAAKRGAVGVILLLPPTVKPSAWDAAVRRSKNGSYKWVSSDGIAAKSYETLKAVASLNPQYSDLLFGNASTTAQQVFALAAEGKSHSFPLNISAAMGVKTATKNVEGSNLVGIIKGSDPVLKNEYVVYSAHLDHFGIGAPVKGDSIYNGAHDDASGNAILLEVAKAYRSLPAPPKRSIAFAVVTGEEMGLLGSDYFINNMPLKEGKVVANLAIDMPFFFHPVLDIVPYGADHSSLGVQTQKTAQDLGLKISPDPFPEQVVFIRSDHYSFIKKGIPALFIKSGFLTVPSDTVDRSKSDVGWRSTHYHTPQDDMRQPFDFTAATMHAKVNFLIGYYVSNEKAAPAWNRGDFFGQKFTAKSP